MDTLIRGEAGGCNKSHKCWTRAERSSPASGWLRDWQQSKASLSSLPSLIPPLLATLHLMERKPHWRDTCDDTGGLCTPTLLSCLGPLKAAGEIHLPAKGGGENSWHLPPVPWSIAWWFHKCRGESGTHCTGPFLSRDPVPVLGGMRGPGGKLKDARGLLVKNVIYLGRWWWEQEYSLLHPRAKEGWSQENGGACPRKRNACGKSLRWKWDQPDEGTTKEGLLGWFTMCWVKGDGARGEARSRQAGPGTVLGGIFFGMTSDLDLKCHGKTLKDLRWGGASWFP